MDVNCSTDRRTSLAPRSPENESGRRATEREDSGHDEVIVAARARGGSRPRASPPQFLDPALRTLSMKSPIRVLLPASVFLFSGWILACEGHAPSTPEGWQTLTNVTGKCQLAIPPDWTAQTAGPPGAVKTGTSYSVLFMLTAPRATFAQMQSITKRTWRIRPAFAVVSESATRAIYRYSPADWYEWTVIVAGTPACAARLTSPVANDSLAMQIAATLSPR